MAKSGEIEKATAVVTELELGGETGLLVNCARLRLSERNVRSIKDILEAGVDWDLLFKNANWHRLTLLISHHLRSADFAGLVPAPVMTQLQGIHYQNLARNMILQDELVRILSAFNREGLPVVLLKGSALLDSIYQDISLRPMSDLDILVHPEDLDRAESLVLGLDYVYLSNPDDVPSESGGRHLPNLRHRKKGVFIEVHHHIVDADDACYFDISDFWARARPVRKANADALVFAPEDSVAHLGIKFLADRRFQSNSALGQLCDISETIIHHGDALDWDLIAGFSREKGFGAALYSVFYACQRILGTPVPAATMQDLQPAKFDRDVLDQFLRRRVLDIRPWLAHNLVDHQRTYTRIRMLAAVLGRFSRLAANIFTGDGRSRSSKYQIKTVLPRMFRVMLKPSDLMEDLRLDRWLHDLYR